MYAEVTRTLIHLLDMNYLVAWARHYVILCPREARIALFLIKYLNRRC